MYDVQIFQNLGGKSSLMGGKSSPRGGQELT